jgi:dephospho-CoA kinase
VHQRPAFRIGLTGGIASGKSLVADAFRELGVAVIDTDIVAREVVAPGQAALAEIERRFGPDVIAADGTLDRAALRRIVFASSARRVELEQLLHPLIREETLRQAATAGGPYQIIVVPLLTESPMRHEMERILVVDVPEDVQLQRLLARDGDDREQASRMIAAQASRAERLAIADDVISNSGSPEATRSQVEALHRRYLELAKQR